MSLSVLWSAEDFSRAVEPISQPGMIGDVVGISIDSRTVSQGDAFFAIKGDRFDGHAFAKSALEAGAAVVVLEEAQREAFADLVERVVFVDDVLKALERLGRAARARMQGKVIAVTGSVGKTSTKDALRSAFAPSGKVHAAVSSFNNHWGVPLTLARMPADTDFGVFEIGMNHSGEISVLVRMVRPHIAIVTTVVAAHIGNFSGIEEIAAAKAEIFEAVEPNGVALVNGDNEFGDFLAEKAADNGVSQIARFGRGEASDVRLVQMDLRADGSDLAIKLFDQDISVTIRAPGEHLAMNALAVLGAVSCAGGDVAKACEVLAGQGATKGRGERHALSLASGSLDLIDESYNANPSSVEAALKVLALADTQQGGRKIAVLGDMLELGDESAAMHAGLKPALLDAQIDQVYLCGPMMHHLWQELPLTMRANYAESSSDLIASLKDDLRGGDTVMVKGSLGSRMGPIVTALIEEFSN